MRFVGDSAVITREHAKGDVAVRGGASDLLLFLWHRIPADRLEVFGDPALLDRDKSGLEELAAALRTTGVTVQTTVVDLRTAHGVRASMQEALAPFGGVLDILVPNVGALIAGPFETLESAQLQECFAINFFTHVYACRVAVLPPE